MKLQVLLPLLAMLAATPTPRLVAQGTAFSYQGALQVGGSLANNVFDLNFTLHDALSGGAQFGPLFTAPAVAVTNGLFNVTLDFGAGAFPGAARFLQIAVRTNGSGAGFTLLSPRQPVLPTPYAIAAGSVPAGSIGSAQLAAGAVATASLQNGAVTAAKLQNNAVTSATIANGTIQPADLDTNALGALFWRTGGNSGATPGVHFLGTRDNQALEIKVNGLRAVRIEPSDVSPNVIFGSAGNVVGAAAGAAIGGGGVWFAPHHIGAGADYSVIGGGLGHTNAAGMAVISGGSGHIIQSGALWAAIGGGSGNRIASDAFGAAIGGGIESVIGTNAAGATVSGGFYHRVASDCQYATIGGGLEHSVEARYATIGGGFRNAIEAEYATVGGGYQNKVETNSGAATIAGGDNNRIEAGSGWAAIGGGLANAIRSNSVSATIAGGQLHRIETNSEYSVIAGGSGNVIQPLVSSGTIAGGVANAIHRNAYWSAIGGGAGHVIGTNSAASVISGGDANRIGRNAQYSTIGGGRRNVIESNATETVIAGGWDNRIQATAVGATLSGGYTNVIGPGARYATIPGGHSAAATRYGQLAYASGAFSAPGDAQTSVFVARGETTTATPTELFLNGTSGGQRLTIPRGSAWAFDILVVGRTEESGEFNFADKAAYQIRGLIDSDGSGVRVYGKSVTVLYETGPAYHADVDTNPASSALVVRVTGVTGASVRWVATVRTAEVKW